MRFLRAAVLISLVGSGFAHPAHATGNVLVPSSGTTPSTSNSGSVFGQPAPAASPTSQPATAPAAPTITPSATAPASIMAMPTTPPPTAAAQPAPSPIKTPSTGTQVIQLPAVPTGVGNLMPFTLSVSGPEKYVWDAADVKTLNKHLGFSAAKISESCALSYSGMIMTNKGVYLFDTGFSPHTDAGYDGHIQGLSIKIQGLCDGATPLSANLGYIVQIGDKYSVPLQSVSCPKLPTNQSIAGVAISYGSRSTCQYK